MDANSASPLDPEELGGLIADLVHDHVERALPVVIGHVQAAIPAPIHGKDGAPGPRGADGSPGRHGDDGPAGRDGKDADPEIVRVVAAEAVTELVESFGNAIAKRFAQADG
jgi:hypothetical protein